MHSMEYLLQEGQNKYFAIQSRLQECQKERDRLHNNFEHVKLAVQQTLNQHIETLQCRAKWLNCHAESVFHLKEDALDQQISQLNNDLKQLETILKSNDDHPDEQLSRHLLKDALKKIGDNHCFLAETGSMTFSADDEQLEKAIVSFGDILVDDDLTDNYSLPPTNESSLKDFDTLSDDYGIFILKEKPTQKEIEMEVKSIEMIHLTPDSASVEAKNHVNQLQSELQMINKKLINDNDWLVKAIDDSSTQLNIDTFEEEASKDSWLRSKDQVKPGHSIIKTSNWVLNCVSSPPLEWLSAAKDSTVISSSNNDKKKIWLQEFDRPMSDFLRATTMITTREEKSVQQPNARVPLIEDPSIFLHSHRSNNEFLRKTGNAPALAGALPVLRKNDHSVIDNPLMTKSWNIEKPNIKDWCIQSPGETSPLKSTMKSTQDQNKTNLDLLDAILLSKSFLRQPENNDTLTKPRFNPNLECMNKISAQPSSVFLRSRSITLAVDDSLCSWLVGKNEEQCCECDEKLCKFEDLKGKEWLKTATNW